MHIYTENCQEKKYLMIPDATFLEDQVTCMRKNHHHFQKGIEYQ